MAIKSIDIDNMRDTDDTIEVMYELMSILFYNQEVIVDCLDLKDGKLIKRELDG